MYKINNSYKYHKAETYWSYLYQLSYVMLGLETPATSIHYKLYPR